MRIYVRKPQGGRIDVRVDDRQGVTRRQDFFSAGDKADVKAKLAPILDAWEATRDRVREARKRPQA